MTSFADSPGTTAGTAPAWMLVGVAGERYALPIEAVGEVLPLPAVSPVPMAPAWVLGIAEVRDMVVPVVDLGLRLRGKPSSSAGRLVLTHADDAGERVGLVVDAVAGLVPQGVDPGVAPIELERVLDPAVDL